MKLPKLFRRSSPAANVAARLERAVAYHGSGQLVRAESLYREILARAPRHFDALHLLGVVCHQTGRHDAAVQMMSQAIAVDASQPAVHSNLGLALQSLGQSGQALASYDRALGLNPRDAGALSNRGNTLRDLGRVPEALESYDRAIALNPQSASGFNNRGMALRDLKRLADALASFDEAIRLNSGYAQAYITRGIVLLEMKQPEKALASFDGALSIHPADGAALCNRGNALQALERHEEALECYDRAIAREPGFAEAFNNRGNALCDLNRPQDALESIERALAFKPQFAGALNNRGIALRALYRQAEALASFEQAIALDPGYADAHCNRGNVLQDLKMYPDALESYARALRCDPDHAQSQWNESLCRLLIGDLAAGWVKYEWRWKTEQRNAVRDFPQPLWLGREPLQGKTILLHAEQGLGDTIQFCRYASMVSALGATVVLEVQRPLKALLSNLRGVSTIRARGESLPAFDFHCPLLSLPLAFDTNLGSIPAQIPYLQCEPAALEQWRERLGPKARPRVGLVWRGAADTRSVPLAQMLAVVSGDAQFFSLQKDASPADQNLLSGRPDILQFAGELRNFSDAPIVGLMDLVVTVDTSVAHLAGAMGKEVWILLAANAEWRWFINRDDSPWYPSARLFRASAIGDWSSVIEQVKNEMKSALRAAR